MPISQKIIERVEATAVSQDEKKLMMKILEIEDNGVYRFEAEYEKAVKAFIVKRDEEVTD